MPGNTARRVERRRAGGRRTLMMLITTWDMAGGGPFAATSIATVGLSKTVDTVQTLFMGRFSTRY